MVGKTLPFALIGLLDVVMIALIGVFWFEVPLQGNSLVLLLGAVLLPDEFRGSWPLYLHHLLTQQQAQISTFFFTMPAFTLRALRFRWRTMPVWIQYLTYANPLRYFLIIIRGVFLKEMG